MAKDLLTHIEELRTKPQSVRNRYAMIIALVLTLLIATVWALALPSRFAENPQNVPENDSNKQSITQSISAGFASIGQMFTNVTQRWKEAVPETDTGEDTIPSNQLDFEAMLASSTIERKEQTASSTATTTASSTAETNASSTSTTTAEVE